MKIITNELRRALTMLHIAYTVEVFASFIVEEILPACLHNHQRLFRVEHRLCGAEYTKSVIDRLDTFTISPNELIAHSDCLLAIGQVLRFVHVAIARKRLQHICFCLRTRLRVRIIGGDRVVVFKDALCNSSKQLLHSQCSK